MCFVINNKSERETRKIRIINFNILTSRFFGTNFSSTIQQV